MNIFVRQKPAVLDAVASFLTHSKWVSYLFLGVSLLLLSIPIFVISNAFVVTITVAMLAGSILSIVMHHREFSCDFTSHYVPRGVITRKIAYSSYLVTFVASLLTYHANGFSRPPSMVFLTIGLYSLVIIFVLIGCKKGFVVGLAIFTAVYHRTTVYFANPLAYGTDPHSFYDFIIDLSATGSLLETLSTNQYFYAPVYHVRGVISLELLALPVHDGPMFVAISLPFIVLSMLVIYHLLALPWGWQTGVVGMLLFAGADQTLRASMIIWPTLLGGTLIIFALFLTASYIRTSHKLYGVLLFAVLFTTLFTHQISTFVIVVLVSSFVLGSVIYRGHSTRELSVLVILPVILLFDWLRTRLDGPGSPESALERAVDYVIRFYFAEGVSERADFSLPADIVITTTGPFSSLTLLHTIPLGILLGFAIVGAVVWMDRPATTDFGHLGYAIGVCTFVLLVLIGIGPLANVFALRPTRWFAVLYFCLAILAAPGIYAVLGGIRRRSNGAVAGGGLVVIMGVFLVVAGGSAMGAIDDPVFDSAPGAEQMAFSEPDVEKVRHAAQYTTHGSTVATDGRIGSSVGREYADTAFEGDRITLTVDYHERAIVRPETDDHLIVIRPYVYTGSAEYNLQVGEDTFNGFGVPPWPEGYLDQQNKVYDSQRDRCPERCGIYVLST